MELEVGAAIGALPMVRSHRFDLLSATGTAAFKTKVALEAKLSTFEHSASSTSRCIRASVLRCTNSVSVGR